MTAVGAIALNHPKKDDGPPLSTVVWQCVSCKHPGNFAHWGTCGACGEGKPAPATKK